jgi:hypothetical protein
LSLSDSFFLMDPCLSPVLLAVKWDLDEYFFMSVDRGLFVSGTWQSAYVWSPFSTSSTSFYSGSQPLSYSSLLFIVSPESQTREILKSTRNMRRVWGLLAPDSHFHFFLLQFATVLARHEWKALPFAAVLI